MNESIEIKISQPRPQVEVHLPDGRVLSGPRGAQVGDFLKVISNELDAPLMGAVVNGNLKELTYPVNMEATVQPVTLADPDGARIYRRSLTFLLEMAFNQLFPGSILTIDHSVSFGGYYCQVSGRQALSESELDALKALMAEWVEADLPFVRKEIPLADAIQAFRDRGYDDKVRLLSHRRKNYLTVYFLGERMDYHHGYMVPSSGYLRYFFS